MIDIKTAEKEIRVWIYDYLSVPRVQLNNLSACPYAKPAIDQNKIRFLEGVEVIGDLANLSKSWDDDLDGVVLVYDRGTNAQEFITNVLVGNKSHLQPNGLVALEDHPDIPENIAGLTFNQGTYALIIVQKLDKLNKASESLRAKGYYTNWTQSDLDDVVSWRKKC